MKSACVSIVRNEADIIEVFVRYHARIFDHVFVIEHLSRDGTSEILHALLQEGLPLTVFKENAPFHNQGRAMTKAIKEVRRLHTPQVIMPLDCDEFVVGDIKRAAHELPGPAYTLAVPWHNYAMTAEDIPHLNVLKRLTFKNKKVNPAQHKPLIPGPVFDHDVYCKEGCHEVYVKEDKVVKLIHSKYLYLAHFPVRSVEQFLKKSLVGWIAKVANPENNGRLPDWSHWKLFFDRAKKQERPTLETLQRLALGYTVDQKDENFQLVCDPVACDSCDIKYPYDGNYGHLEALADASELLAAELAKRSQGIQF